MKHVLRNQDGRMWNIFGSGQEQVVGSCEHPNELLVSIKYREFLD
jgi:hypothetical protein